METVLRHDWRVEEVLAIHDTPLFALVDRARAVHCAAHPGGEVQLCTLLSVKTGGCSEDCSYCSQSAHHKSELERQPLLEVSEVLAAAERAKEVGSTRFCMGAAWRQINDDAAFERVLDMVRGVKKLGLETCCTLGMLSPQQAARLAEAGLDAYNHNLDTSRAHYPSIVRSHGYDERLETLQAIRDAGIHICSGGIIGMGERVVDRCAMLVELAGLDPHPESVPINALVPIEGTPLADLPPVDPIALVRMIATARILMPASKVRLSAGRSALSRETQLLCLYCGANSIFYGDKLLTTGNTEEDDDRRLLEDAGLVAAAPAG